MPPRKVGPAQRATPASGRDGASNTLDARCAFHLSDPQQIELSKLFSALRPNAGSTETSCFIAAALRYAELLVIMLRERAAIGSMPPRLGVRGSHANRIIKSLRRTRHDVNGYLVDFPNGPMRIELQRLCGMAEKVEADLGRLLNSRGSPGNPYGRQLFRSACEILLHFDIEPKPNSRDIGSTHRKASAPMLRLAEQLHKIVTGHDDGLPDQRSCAPSKDEFAEMRRIAILQKPDLHIDPPSTSRP